MAEETMKSSIKEYKQSMMSRLRPLKQVKKIEFVFLGIVLFMTFLVLLSTIGVVAIPFESFGTFYQILIEVAKVVLAVFSGFQAAYGVFGASEYIKFFALSQLTIATYDIFDITKGLFFLFPLMSCVFAIFNLILFKIYRIGYRVTIRLQSQKNLYTIIGSRFDLKEQLSQYYEIMAEAVFDFQLHVCTFLLLPISQLSDVAFTIILLTFSFFYMVLIRTILKHEKRFETIVCCLLGLVQPCFILYRCLSPSQIFHIDFLAYYFCFTGGFAVLSRLVLIGRCIYLATCYGSGLKPILLNLQFDDPTPQVTSEHGVGSNFESGTGQQLQEVSTYRPLM